MAELVLADRVAETTTSTGTGALTLAGALDVGFRAFSAVVADSVPFPYVVHDPQDSSFEAGIGVLDTGTLVRRMVTASSNGGELVDFAAGTKQVFLAAHAAVVRARSRWGTGEDGELVISGSTVVTLQRDAHYTRVRWASGSTGQINTNGYRLHVLELLDLLNAPSSAIHNDAAYTVPGGWGTLGGGIVGGGADDFAARTGAVAGGPAAAGSMTSGHFHAKRIGPLPLDACLVGVPGGAGGGGSNGSAGAGIVEVRARRILRGPSTAVGAISARGGTRPLSGGVYYNAGGGGRVRVIYAELLGTPKSQLIVADGGHARGAAGTGSGRGGDGGAIETFDVVAGTRTYTEGTVGAVGILGLTGAGGECRADL